MTRNICDSFNFITTVDRIKDQILFDYYNELKRYEKEYSNMKSFEMDCCYNFLKLNFNFSFEELKFICNAFHLELYCCYDGNITIILKSFKVPEIRKKVKILYDCRYKQRQKLRIMTIIKDTIDTLKKELLENEISESRYGGIINWRQK